MQGDSVVFELTDREIRAFWFANFLLRKLGHRCRPVRFDRIPLPTGFIEQGNVRDEQGLIDLLAKYVRQYACKRAKAYLAVPLQQGFVRTYSLPWLAKRDRESAISLLVAEEVPIDRSDLLYDFQIVAEKKSETMEIILGAARKSLLERYVFIFEKTGFKVEKIEFAWCILGQTLGLQPKEDVLYLQEESAGIQMVLFRGRVPESMRTFLFSSFAKEERENIRTGRDVYENEIRRFLAYYSAQHNDFNLKRIIWNGDALVRQLAQKIADTDYLLSAKRAKFISVSEPWKKILKESKGSGEVSVGYGLRICTHLPGLNLWRRPNREQKFRKIFCRLALVSTAFLIAETGGCILLSKKAQSLGQEVQGLAYQGVKIQKQAENQERLEKLWKKAMIHSENVGDELLKVRAEWGSELKVEQIVYKQGSFLLSGSTDDWREVQGLLGKLRAMGWQQTALTSYELISPDKVEFSLSAKRGNDTGKTLISNNTEDKVMATMEES